MYTVIVSANNNEEVLTLPVVPIDIPIRQSQNNEEYKTVNNGTLNLPGNNGLKSIPISSIFPNKDYSWIKQGAEADGWKYVEFFEKWRDLKVPIRLMMISGDDKEYLNIACLVESFTYKLMRSNDISYDLDLKEYHFVEIRTV